MYGDVELIIWLLALLARGLSVQGVFESPQHGIDDKIRMTAMNEKPSTRNKLVSQPLEVLATESESNADVVLFRVRKHRIS